MRRKLNHKIWLLVLIWLVGCTANPNERNNTGNDLNTSGQYIEAAQAYQVAQVLAPDLAVPYYNAGVALANSEALDAAALALEQALETADESLIKQAYYNLGNVYFSAGRYFDAVDMFKQVLLLDSEDAQARYNYELALLYAIPPTPENQQQQNEPEQGETDPETTPTPQPNELTGPTPTPPLQDTSPDESETPEGGSGDFFEDTPSTLVPQEAGRMSVEDAERILDAIEQEALSEYLEDGVPSGDPIENDW